MLLRLSYNCTIFICVVMIVTYTPDTASAVDASGHDGLDEGSNILILHSSVQQHIHINRSLRAKKSAFSHLEYTQNNAK